MGTILRSLNGRREDSGGWKGECWVPKGNLLRRLSKLIGEKEEKEKRD